MRRTAKVKSEELAPKVAQHHRSVKARKVSSGRLAQYHGVFSATPGAVDLRLLRAKSFRSQEYLKRVRNAPPAASRLLTVKHANRQKFKTTPSWARKMPSARVITKLFSTTPKLYRSVIRLHPIFFEKNKKKPTLHNSHKKSKQPKLHGRLG